MSLGTCRRLPLIIHVGGIGVIALQSNDSEGTTAGFLNFLVVMSAIKR